MEPSKNIPVVNVVEGIKSELEGIIARLGYENPMVQIISTNGKHRICAFGYRRGKWSEYKDTIEDLQTAQRKIEEAFKGEVKMPY